MPTDKKYDVLAIGNSIVDILVRADEAFLSSLGLEKGTMTLLDNEKSKKLFEYLAAIKNLNQISEIKEMSGGCAANTVASINSFGGKTAYIGKVADDESGKIFKAKLSDQGVDFSTETAKNGSATAKSLIIVTPDGMRTMCTHLGAAGEITVDDVKEDLIKDSKILFVNAFSWDSESGKASAMKAIKIAKDHAIQVAFALCDKNCVKRFRDEFVKLFDESIDILFGNEKEIMAFCGTEDHSKAVDHMLEKCSKNDKIAALTVGKEGALIVNKSGTVKSPVIKVDKIIDKTGTGAMFISGFLYGITHGMDLEKSAKLGNMAAAEGIQTFGARPEKELKSLLKDL